MAFAQDSINIDQLSNLLTSYHSDKLDADLADYEDLTKLTWLLFIPGVGYDFINQNPYIVYNTSSLFAYFNSKLKQKHSIKSLKKKSTIEVELDQIKLNRYYLRFKELTEELSFDEKDYKIYSQLYSIKNGKYQADEISLESFLMAEIQLNSRKKALYSTQTKLYDLILQIELLTHSSVNYAIKKGD